MPVVPATVNDRIFYALQNIYGDKDITVTMLDGSNLNIIGNFFVNGLPVSQIGMIPIASQAEAEAGIDNTKAMTPLRVEQAINVQALPVEGGLLKGQLRIAQLDNLAGPDPGLLSYNNGTFAIQGGGALSHIPTLEFYSINTNLYTRNGAAGAYRAINFTYNSVGFPQVINAQGGVTLPVGNPVNPQDAAHKAYVDSKVAAVPTVTDGDKGDIIVSGGGTNWVVENGVISVAKLATDVTAKFVDAAGDTMTGDLLLGNGAATLSAASGNMNINVAGAASLLRFQINGATCFSVSNPDVVVGLGCDLSLNRDPTQPLHAATKQYVDNKIPVFTQVDAKYTMRPSLFMNTGGYLISPDPTQLATATEFDIRWIERPTTYVNNVIASQGSGSAATAQFFVVTGTAGNNNVTLFVSNGTANPGVFRAIRPAIGQIGACKITWRGSDGRMQFFNKSVSEPADMISNAGWTQVGADGVGVTGVTWDAPFPLVIGAYASGGAPWNTNLYCMSFSNVIDGTPFAMWDSRGMDINYTDAYGTPWTMQGTAWEWRDYNDKTIQTSAQAITRATSNTNIEVAQYAVPKAFASFYGNASNGIYMADPAFLAGASQLDIRWIETGPTTTGPAGNIFAAQGISGSAQSFVLQQLSAVQGTMSMYLNNSSASGASSGPAVRPTTPGKVQACRVTWRNSDGVVKYYFKNVTTVPGMLDNTGWTHNGGVVTGFHVGEILPNRTETLSIGQYSAGTQPINLSLHAFSISTTIDGTPQALYRADTLSSSYTDQYGNVWNIMGTNWDFRDANLGVIASSSAVSAIEAAARNLVTTVAAPKVLVYMNGTANNYLSLPDPAALAGASELDLRWIERGFAYSTSSLNLFAQSNGSTDTSFRILTAGTSGGVVWQMADATGTNLLGVTGSVIRPPVGAMGGVRITWRASDGRIQFFSKPGASTVSQMNNNTGWVQVGADGTSRTIPFYNSTLPFAVGAASNGGNAASVYLYSCSLATAIDGTPFALYRADNMAPQYMDSFGNTWTMIGSAWEWRGPDDIRLDGPTGTAIYTGTGVPENVVAAGVGASYFDTAATNGAIEWVKATGTGTTGWRIVSGDTGLVNLCTWDTAGAYTKGGPLGANFAPRAASAGYVRLRRLNSTVFMEISNVQAAADLSANVEYDLLPGLASSVIPFFPDTTSNYIPMSMGLTSLYGVMRFGNASNRVQVTLLQAIATGTVCFHSGVALATWATGRNYPIAALP